MADLRSVPAEAPVNVVLVDDDKQFVEGLRTIVDEEPTLSVVGVAENGLEAIELVDELAPEAVVIDLHMPLLDGVSAVARIRNDHPGLCLIAMTADQASDLHAAVADAGADVVLMKDELPEVLSARIAAARGRQRAVM
ncbi:MAG TPA: response regulator [Gaiellaceae bacterium]|nr:response regulator [Gaiellaceae bacterium]